jgi:hypothetical protein
LAFGFIFGFIALKNRDKEDSFFMGGLWTYKDQKSFIYYLLAMVILVGLPAVFLILLLPKFISVAVVGYLLKVLGVTWAGFSLIYLMAQIQKKLALIILHPNDES